MHTASVEIYTQDTISIMQPKAGFVERSLNQPSIMHIGALR